MADDVLASFFDMDVEGSVPPPPQPEGHRPSTRRRSLGPSSTSENKAKIRRKVRRLCLQPFLDSHICVFVEHFLVQGSCCPDPFAKMVGISLLICDVSSNLLGAVWERRPWHEKMSRTMVHV